MKHMVIIFYMYGTLLVGMAVLFLPDRIFTDVYAKEEYKPRHYKYYTSMEIKSGDTLWSIACQYADENYITVEDYIMELKNINHLPSDKIIEGHYLTVFYYSEHYK